MKSIKVKAYNKLMENIITEDSIKLDGETGDFKGKLKKRIIDAVRLAKECRAAAKLARDNGDDESAEWLEKRAEDYEQAARNWNQDVLDDDSEVGGGGSEDNTETANKQSSPTERANNAAKAAQQAADNAQEAADAAQKTADDLAAEGKDNSEAQAKADKAKAKAQEAQQAADEAKQHAEAAEKAEKAGDTEKAEEEADAAEAAESAAEEAASDAHKAANGEPTSDEDSSDSDDLDTGDAEDTNADGGSKSSGEDSDADTRSSSESDSDSDSDADSDDSESDDSDADDSEDDQSNKSKGKSGKNSKDKSDSSSGESDNEDGDEDSDEDEEESDSDDAPIKDIFADEEDIPQMPSPGQMGQEPRDPTVDEIIKQLGKLEGEAKRGAIDGLTDLLNKKTESLSEAFKKGIREFSDEEWDDLNDETIDRIEKVKKIDTIDNVDNIKATFKGWSENEVSRQELADEENQNIQKDILAKRAKEKEAERYSNLESLHDFELDFEACIRDQVDLVMQEYQSYDEINPEYELEDTIMKADIQRMIPDEAIPTVAVFFDQSGSWGASDVQKGQRAIATVKQKYVDTGLCVLDIYYFGDHVVTNPNDSRKGGGTTAWPEIVKTIASHDYKNVVIMTDDDMNAWNNHGESYTVEGCVWWLWRQGRRAPILPKQVRGMQHNFECQFY